MCDNEVPRFAPNGYRLPDRLPIGHRLVDTAKQQWLIGPPIGSGGFGEIYLTRQYNEDHDNERLTQAQIIAQSATWNHVIKFEHFSGPLFAEINFYLRVAKKETVDDYMATKKLKHLGMPRYIASGIYDPAKPNNPVPVCKNITSTTNGTTISLTKNGNVKKAARAKPATANRPIGKNNNNKEKKYRFLVMQRFGPDVEKILLGVGSRFDMKTAFTLALKIIDTLEYIHSHGYVHADVKASNLLVGLKDIDMTLNSTSDIMSSNQVANKRQTKTAGTTPRRKTPSRAVLACTGPLQANVDAYKDYKIDPGDEVYLIDFGLVEKYCHKDGRHREYTEDQRRANNGTVEFSSRDAHIGAFSRRSDLESLAYNLLFWVSGGRLPWTGCLKDHQLVETSKKYYMSHLEEFVNYCFNDSAEPIDAAKVLADDRLALKVNGNGVHNKIASNNNNNSHISNHLSMYTENQSPKYNNSTATSRASSTSTTNSRSASKTKGDGVRSMASGSTNSSISVSAAKRSRKSASRVAGGISSRQSSTQDSIMCSALYDFVSYIAKLAFSDDPDYYLLKTILSNALVGSGVNVLSPGRNARKRGGSDNVKKNPPKMVLPKCENPTPAMLEILRKMQLKKH